MTLKLCFFPETISIAAALALSEAGLDFEPVRVDFASGEQTKPDYHAINPKGRVPALITDQGILTETGAILDYIATLAPQAGLVPDDPFATAKMREAMYYLASTMHVNHAHGRRAIRWADQEASHKDMLAKVPETMTDSCAYIENSVLQGPFVLGEALSLADAYLYVVCTWLEGDGVDVAGFPKIEQFMQVMADRASVKSAVAAGMLA